VARLDHLKVSDVIDLREILDRMECTATGLVVIGTRLSVSPYYAAEAPIGEGAPARIVG